MRRIAYLTVALVMLVIGLVGLVTLVASLLPSEPVYSVASVQTGLRTRPIAWIGRTVRVRGVFTYSTPSSNGLADPFRPPHGMRVWYALYEAKQQGTMVAAAGAPLTLQLPPGGAIPPAPPNPVSSRARHAQWFLSRLIPALNLAPVPTVRVTLLARYGRGCPPRGCADAQLDERPRP